MSTPTLKLLLNALRLGQPQDPQAAIFALAEHILAQDDLIEDLRKRITVVQSAAQILETKAVRLENELESFLRGGYASAPRHQAQFQAQQQQQAQMPAPGADGSIDPLAGFDTNQLAEQYLKNAYAGYDAVGSTYDTVDEYGVAALRKCNSCGESGHFSKECPTARNCRKCGEPGHNQRVCPQSECCHVTTSYLW